MEKFDINVSSSEIDKEIEILSKTQNLDSEKSRLLYGSESSRHRLEDSLFESKLFNHIEGIATVEEVKV